MKILIKNGSYRNEAIANEQFTMLKGFQTSAKGGFVTVRNEGRFPGFPEEVRIRVDSISDYAAANGESIMEMTEHAPVAVPVATETDEEIMKRIGERFEILDEMTRATINGDVRAMIVQGPPGVGKSYGVTSQLERANLFEDIANKPAKYEVVKGAMTAIGLYVTLYKHSDPGHVLVFDDCDSILQDELSLNILKAALDSGKKRKIFWNSDSHLLRREGVPDSFDFKGSVIFITNIKFDNIKSKKLLDHLEALQSRCHFLDLTMNTMRDRLLRIRQIAGTGALFEGYNFDKERENEILDFMTENQNKLREVSLRMALKIADLAKITVNWRAMATMTCMRG